MKRAVLAVAAALALSGCARLKADKLMMTGLEDLNAQRYEQCVRGTSEAIPIYERLLEAFSPQERSTSGELGGLGTSRTARAKCRWALNRQAEAIADLEEGIKLQNERCHSNLSALIKDQKRRACEDVANDIETLAKWKKELAKK